MNYQDFIKPQFKTSQLLGSTSQTYRLAQTLYTSTRLQQTPFTKWFIGGETNLVITRLIVETQSDKSGVDAISI